MMNDNEIKSELDKLKKLEIVSNKIIKSHGLSEGVSAYEIEWLAREMLGVIVMLKLIYQPKENITNTNTEVGGAIAGAVGTVFGVQTPIKKDNQGQEKKGIIQKMINRIKW